MNSLGANIGHLKHRYRKQKGNSADVDQIVKRLDDYQKYLRQIKKERRQHQRKEERALLKKIRTESYKKAFSRKPVINPYINIYENSPVMPDPNLEKRYKSSNIYSMYAFRHLLLPKSKYQIRAGQAWGGLIKSWKGFKAAKGNDDDDRMKIYGSLTQRWADMLEVEYIPDFPEIGLSAEGFKNGRKLKILRS